MSIGGITTHGNISTDALSGSVVTNSYVAMTQTVYAVPEHIADSMSLLNGLATMFFSIAALMTSIPIGIGINYIFTEDMTKPQLKAIMLAFVCASMISILLFIIAVVCTCKRRGVWNRVKLASQVR